MTKGMITNSESVAAVAVLSSEVRILPTPVVLPVGFVTEGRKVPLMIERAQAYYWTAKWQDGVEHAIRDIEGGEYVRFDSDDPTDVARWLWDGNDE